MVAQAERRHARPEEPRSAFAAAHARRRAVSARRSAARDRCLLPTCRERRSSRRSCSICAGSWAALLTDALSRRRARRRCWRSTVRRCELLRIVRSKRRCRNLHRTQAATRRRTSRAMRCRRRARRSPRFRNAATALAMHCCRVASDARLAGRGGAVRRAGRCALRHRCDSARLAAAARRGRAAALAGAASAGLTDGGALATQDQSRDASDRASRPGRAVRRGAAAHPLLRPAADAARLRSRAPLARDPPRPAARAASASARTSGCPRNGSRPTACRASPCRSTWRTRA